MSTQAPDISPLPLILIEPAVRAALLEDFGRSGDITTNATISANTTAKALLAARENGRIAGMDLAICAFRLLDPTLTISLKINDGNNVNKGDVIATVEGHARAILSAERVALNFLGHLSGIATATRELVEQARGTKARIICTRKTTPGRRAFEKYAVRCGGGFNHRFGLDDGILIKDNHIIAAGGITKAIQAARHSAGHMVHVEIEVDNLAQLEQALAAGANSILLDNMKPDMLREAVRITNGRAMLEASGNINVDTVSAVAATGVDLISSGAITHSARCLDLGLDFLAI